MTNEKRTKLVTCHTHIVKSCVSSCQGQSTDMFLVIYSFVLIIFTNTDCSFRLFLFIETDHFQYTNKKKEKNNQICTNKNHAN